MGLASFGQTVVMADMEVVWARVEKHAGETFRTVRGLEFTYRVPGKFLRVARDGRDINRSLSRTNFQKALQAMPAARPGDIRDREGASYTWAILMDPRIRGTDW